MEKQETNLEFQDQHLVEIGAIVVSWTRIEHLLSVALCGFYGIKLRAGLVFTSNIPLGRRISMLKIVANGGGMKSEESAKSVVRLLKKLEKLNGEVRIPMLHGLWSPQEDPDLIQIMSIKAGGTKLVTSDEKMSTSDLQEARIKVVNLYLELVEALLEAGYRERLEAIE